MLQEEQLVLVNSRDQVQGTNGKYYIHTHALLHRACSVMIYNNQGELLLQKRAKSKYHSPSLWSNTCCGHPRLGEMPQEAAHRRLYEELGMTQATLTPVTELTYCLSLGDGMYEHEYNHIFNGYYTGDFKLNSEEVSDVMWVKKDVLLQQVALYPEQYSCWFRLFIQQYIMYLFPINPY